MPHFDVDSISIDPEDYLDACSSRERRDLLDELHARYPEEFNDIIEDALDDASVEVEDVIRSDSHRLFIYHLNTLRKGWYGVSREDADIIAILSKKYGAI